MKTQQSTDKRISITRIDPTDWYVGMKESALQLMVYGPGIRSAEVATRYPGARIESIVRPDSPNYLLIYLNIHGAEAGVMPLTFSIGECSETVGYTLKKREMDGEKRLGFTNGDVLYMLLPDRFACGNPRNGAFKGMRDETTDRSKPGLRHGGDLLGIRQHLDYFSELGVTALWLTPVLENDSPNDGENSSYHGYATTDYYRIDPRFGTNEEYRQLIDEAHGKGLKVIMDMIFNHCGFCHPWVADMPFADWFNAPEWLSPENQRLGKVESDDTESGGIRLNDRFLQTSYKLTPVLDPYASQIDRRETVEGWFVPSMPDLNQRNPHVMRYLTQTSIWWIETAGIDGIRMDTYPYADREGMSQWMRTINSEYPNFNVVGETWVTEPAYTAAWQKGSRLCDTDSHLKTVMDFAFYDRINKAAQEETDDWWFGMNRIYNTLCYDFLYQDAASVLAFIDNHDTDRFLGTGCDTLALRQALALLLTMKRTPQLYYGTEILMNGTKEGSDGNVRKDFPGGFPGDTRSAFTREGRTLAQNAMFNWLSRLLHWRRGNKTIAEGKQTQFIPQTGVYVVARQFESNTVMTVINGTPRKATLPVARYAEVIGRHESATDITTGKRVVLSRDVMLRPRQTMILEF